MTVALVMVALSLALRLGGLRVEMDQCEYCWTRFLFGEGSSIIGVLLLLSFPHESPPRSFLSCLFLVWVLINEKCILDSELKSFICENDHEPLLVLEFEMEDDTFVYEQLSKEHQITNIIDCYLWELQPYCNIYLCEILVNLRLVFDIEVDIRIGEITPCTRERSYCDTNHQLNHGTDQEHTLFKIDKITTLCDSINLGDAKNQNQS